MRHTFRVVLLIAVLGSAPLVKAQEETSKLDLYGGYDFVRYNANPRINGLPPSESFNANGLGAQIAYNPTLWLGLSGEISGYAVARRGFATTHQVSFLFGPRIYLRQGKIRPYVQAFVGPVWAEDGITFGSVTAFGMTAGGGFDLRVSKHIAIRPAQAEYFLTKFYDGNNNQQNNFRFSAGIVFRFG